MTDHISSLTFETIRQHTLSWRMPGGDLTLHGYSRAADGTAFMIPELWIGLDAGRMVHTRRPEHLFITHTHSDHVFELPHLKTRRKPPTIYAPTAMLGLIEQYCEAAQRLTDCEPDPEQWVQLDTSYHLVGVEPGDRWKMALKVRDALWVEAVRCDHTVPCLGYRFLKPQRRLKEAFRDRPGGELAALRAEGVVLGL
ncbi:MAG: MBL fold metallo-hydrolase [Myxococcota bacterium]